MNKFTQSIMRQPQAVPPVWFMRQAGRYHKHYQGLRAKHSFMELCKIPELAAEVTMGPIRDFDFDVAILFSDLLFPLEAFGMGLTYGDGGPALGWHLNEESIHKLLPIQDALPQLHFQKEAMRMCRQGLDAKKSLIGFVGGPWTLFTYAAQGRHDGSLIEAKKKLSLFKPFCEKLVPLLIENIRLQFEGGAEVVMLFDTAAGEIDPGIYESLIVPELKKLAHAFPKKLGYYSKGTTSSHFKDPFFSEAHFAGLGFDHRWSLPDLLRQNKSGFIQGNFDQALLFSSKDDFKKHLDRFLKSFKQLSLEERAGWVCGLGHGVLPQTPEAHVKYFVETVREALR